MNSIPAVRACRLLSSRRLSRILSSSSRPSDYFQNNITLGTKEHQSVMVFGSNTNVGKTVITAGVCRAALAQKYSTLYLKPIQTGELDQYFVQLYSDPTGESRIFFRTLYRWKTVTAPHLAVGFEELEAPGDDDIIKSVKREFKMFLNSSNSSSAEETDDITRTLTNVNMQQEEERERKFFSVVETAGGVLSPAPSKTLQADLYRTLRLPIVLVGDAKLGGITATLTAYESLRLRGYTVHAIALIDPPTEQHGVGDMVREHLENCFRGGLGATTVAASTATAATAWALDHAPVVFSFSTLPKDGLLHDWYAENDQQFDAMLAHLCACTSRDAAQVKEMLLQGPHVVWWPFTQHAHVSDRDVNFIDSAYKDHFRMVNPVSLEAAAGHGSDSATVCSNTTLRVTDAFDACASWWTQSVGHGNSDMSLAIAAAAGRYGHVMFPGNLHAPAVQLSKYLTHEGPGKGWASRVFFSDNGSTGMEIAIKMAFRLRETRLEAASAVPGVGGRFHGGDNRGRGILDEEVDVCVVSQRGCYHGDTLGTMLSAEPGVFNTRQHAWYTPSSAVVLPVPSLAYREGVLRVDARDLGDEQITLLAAKERFGSPAGTASSGADQASASAVAYDLTERVGGELYAAYTRYVRAALDAAEQPQQQLGDQKASRRRIGALLLEPLVLGAGGFVFVDPLFQRALVAEFRARGIPVVFDEVASGMYRVGHACAGSVLGVWPDIAVYGKMLTGGYVPLSVTLASAETFDAFLAHGPSQKNEKWRALLHGHSFTANPIACAGALEGIRLLKKSPLYRPESDTIANSFSDSQARTLSLLPGVESVMSMGSVLAITLSPYSPLSSPVSSSDSSSNSGGANPAVVTVALMRKDGVHARPLGNVVYLMPTPLSSVDDRNRLIRVVTRCLTKAYYLRGNATATVVC